MGKFRLNYRKGIILYRAKIINKTSSVFLKMALDTGASYTMTSNEAALAIGINPFSAGRKIEVTTGSGTILVPVIVIPMFVCLGYEIKSLEAICHNLPPESCVEGLLGLNFLKHFNINLKFIENSIEVTKEPIFSPTLPI